MQKLNQKFRFGKILLALLFVVVGFTFQANAASECSAGIKANFDEGIKGDIHGYLTQNTYGLFSISDAEKAACKTYCESKGGKYSEVGWYLYCNRVVVEGAASGKAAGADADPTAQTIATANAAAATAAGKTAASETAGSGSATGTTTGSGASGSATEDSSNAAATGEVIPPADNRYFEVKVQTPFSAAPVGSNTGADELKLKWKTDGYISCDKGEVDNKTCDYHCIYPSNGRILCENLSSGEAWRYYPSTDGKTGRWSQVIRGSDGIDILTTYTTLIYRWLAGFIGIAAVLLIVIGGIMISSAGANQEGMESGKKLITSALAGLVLLFVSSLILYTVNPDFFSQTKGVAEFEKEATVTSTTTPATAAKVAGTYTHAEAMTNLNSGYSVTSTIGEIGVGTDRNTSKTTLEGIKIDAMNGINALIKACNGSSWSITGASELTGHEANSTHYAGQAIDLQMPNTQLSNCMGKYTTSTGLTKEGQAFSKLTVNGYKYWILNEGNHYHIEVNTSNAA
ncbi:MAG: pilin [Candidatus Gracilibacteria bacterium]